MEVTCKLCLRSSDSTFALWGPAVDPREFCAGAILEGVVEFFSLFGAVLEPDIH